ncbi:MAG: baseplate J/gp47 family protein, partial [Oscillospiraceae bacterium]
MIKALTYEEILTTMKTKFKQESGFEADDASDIGIRLRLLAGQLFSQSADISFVANQVFLQTASGEFLDKHAQMRGFSRRLATKAHGTARFATAKAALSDIVIPIGTLCAISGANAQNYATTQQATLLQGKTFVDIPIVAQSSGTNGNAALGCVTILINPPQGINSVTNTTVITGGSEQEDDELLRSRIFKSFAQISNGANQQFYEEIAMQNPKVISVNAISTARGAGTVDVVFDTAEQDTAQINAIKNALDTQL